MKQILFSVLFCFWFTTSFALADTIIMHFALKEHPENAFDYNTKHYRFKIIETNSDSIQVLLYVLDNGIAPFTKKFRFNSQYSIHNHNYAKLKEEIYSILKIKLEPIIQEDPHPITNDEHFHPIKVIAMITFQSSLKGKAYYYFDLHHKEEEEKLDGVKQMLKEILKLEL